MKCSGAQVAGSEQLDGEPSFLCFNSGCALGDIFEHTKIDVGKAQLHNRDRTIGSSNIMKGALFVKVIYLKLRISNYIFYSIREPALFIIMFNRMSVNFQN
jgi:hypothetical protein